MPKIDTSHGFDKLTHMIKMGRKPGDGKGPIYFKKKAKKPAQELAWEKKRGTL